MYSLLRQGAEQTIREIAVRDHDHLPWEKVLDERNLFFKIPALETGYRSEKPDGFRYSSAHFQTMTRNLARSSKKLARANGK